MGLVGNAAAGLWHHACCDWAILAIAGSTAAHDNRRYLRVSRSALPGTMPNGKYESSPGTCQPGRFMATRAQINRECVPKYDKDREYASGQDSSKGC
jgi:hypothetical protein